jgi:putative glutamine amidotransferase
MPIESRAPGARPGTRLAVVEVTRHRPHAPEYHAYVQTLNEHVVAEARRAGFSAERLAAEDLGVAALLEATRDAAAVVVVGGEDLAPHHYGAEAGYPGEGRHLEGADAGQLAVVRRAVQLGTPLLGICRGHQVINVALGGTLVPHLDDEAGLHRGRGSVEQLMTDHDVDLVAGSRLREALARSSVQVRSAHHQAVGLLGAGLRVAARSRDGEVEAVEHVTAPVTGVQWHPEDRGAEAWQLPVLLEQLAVRAAAARRAA